MILRTFQKAYRFGSIRDRIKQERETRLGKVNMETILPIKTSGAAQKIRNIGIIAHIDAGKTTSTQRMLYYAGALPSPGDIDQGTTTMDYMPQERQRGITIRSAAISFNWKDHQINLIDTPGHVDFSAEVTRSLQVLDGVVTILDAVKGVEAQTVKVWDQANRKKLPKICFLNKMDRIGSSLLQTAQSIKKRLKAQPLLTQQPIGDGDTFRGIIDLITMQQVHFKGQYGEFPEAKDVSNNNPRYKFYEQQRLKLVQQVGSFDQEVGDMCLNEEHVSAQKLKIAIRRILLNPQHNDKVCPVLLGSAYRNKGLQPLMNAIIQYLPSPSQRAPVQNINDLNQFRKPLKTEPFTGYIFKVIYDLEKGPLAYTRIYSGLLKKSIELLNASLSIPEKISQIYRVRANQYVNVNEVSAGDIVALSGLKQSRAGDTIIDMNDPLFVMDKIALPTPVFVAPFQLESPKYQRQFNEAMQRIATEDNSISYKNEEETGQFLVNGLGQLHLQVIKDRLVADGIPVRMGNLKINYKETINKGVSKDHSIFRQIKPGTQEEFHLQVQLRPRVDENGIILEQNLVTFEFEKQPEFDQSWAEYVLRKTVQFKSRVSESYDTVQEMKAAREQLSKIPKGKRNVRNPTPLVPIESEFGEDQQQQQPYYHINTLPFETLYELVQNCKIALLYGKHRLPVMGVHLQILDGKYKRDSFTKSVMNQCAEKVIRDCVQDGSILMEPIMEISLRGEPQMIDLAMKDTIKKRGRIQEQEQTYFRGYVPAEGVKGWVKHLRSMGFEVDMKLYGYEEVQGANPLKLLEQNV